jgi:nitrogen regulatory protein PII 2
MKEVMAVIRTKKVNVTKKALGDAGFPAFMCRRCMGRGKKQIDASLLRYVLDTGEIPASNAGESLTEGARLIAKRFFTLVVEDGDVDRAVNIIIEANQTGNPGDGKIFVLPIDETYKVRTGENIL